MPPPDAQDVAAAKDAATKVSKDATRIAKEASKAKDSDDRALKQEESAKVDQTAQKAQAAAARTETKAADATPAQAQTAAVAAAVAAPPTPPLLPELDMDTGKPSGVGEYPLADEAYAELLHDLVKAAASRSTGTGVVHAALPVRTVDPAIAADVEAFFAHPRAQTGPPASKKAAEKQAAADKQVQTDLGTIRGMPGAAAKPLVAAIP